MAKSNIVGVLNYVQIFSFGFLLSSVVLSSVDMIPSNDDVASSICSKTRNVSLCLNMLKLARNPPLLTFNLANYTLNLARTSVVECLGYVQRLEATKTTTVDSQLKNRYSKCSRELKFVVQGIEQGNYCLDIGSSYLLTEAATYIGSHIDGCLDTFKQPPSEPSELLEKVKNLRDICNVFVWVSTSLDGLDEYYKPIET